jgi:hypothetical protein
LQSRLTLGAGALKWWVARLTLEGGVGAAAFAAVDGAIAAAWAGEVGGWVIAGGAGPAVARMRVVTIGKGEDARPLGIATVYEPLRDYIENEIDDIGATQESVWLYQTVLPTLKAKGTSPQNVADRLSTYVLSRSRLTEAEKTAERDFIAQTLADSSPPDDKVSALILRARRLRAYKLIRSLLAQ